MPKTKADKEKARQKKGALAQAQLIAERAKQGQKKIWKNDSDSDE
jgi:hypothetical protein